MKTILAVALITVALILFATPSFAKGDTVKITLTNLESGTTIDSITNVNRFNVWDGPGTFMNGVESKQGFIINWSKRSVAAPDPGLARYRVRFYEGCRIGESASCHSEEPSLAYVVTYVYDPAMKQGYVYLPGKGDEFTDVNVRSIYRGIEGKWFAASGEWQSFVLPLIENRTTTR